MPAFRFLGRLDRALEKVILLSTVLALCACIPPPADLRAGKPAAELTSALSAKHVALCIANQWENTPYRGRLLPLTMRPSNDGYVVTATGYGARFLADVKVVPGGSRTQFFQGQSALYETGAESKNKHTAMEDIVARCQ